MMAGLFTKKGKDKFGSTRPGEVNHPLNLSRKETAHHRGGEAKVAVIGQKVYIKGELRGDEDVAVDGKVEGRIKLNKHLIINKGGVVRAEVFADWVTVSGTLIGNVNARKKVEILSTGHLEGDIKTPNIIISEGALFKGNIDMSQTPEPPAMTAKKEKKLPETKKEEVKEVVPPKSEEPPSPQPPKR